MKKVLLLTVILSLACGCAPSLRFYPGHQELFPDGQTLWEVRIGRGDSQLLAGLLALNKKGEKLEAVLLDSTGIKLLEEKVYSSGAVEVVAALPPLRNKRLGPFLGEGLFRLFFMPDGLNDQGCRRDGLVALCFGAESEEHLVKLQRLGPFVLWSGDYFINYDESDRVIAGARLNGGWLTPYLQIQRSGLNQEK